VLIDACPHKTVRLLQSFRLANRPRDQLVDACPLFDAYEQLTLKDTCVLKALSDSGVLTGSRISIDSHPRWVGNVAPSTVQLDDTSWEPGPAKVSVCTGEEELSLPLHMYDTVPPPPATVIRPGNVIFTGQTPV
jgi:hypothetical protein